MSRAPSLLEALQASPLDPGYAAAARRRESGHERPGSPLRWRVLGMALAGLVLGAGAATAAAQAPAGEAVRTGLADEARSAQTRIDELSTTRTDLAALAEAQRSRVLDGDDVGRTANDELQRLQVAAAATAVTGPALRVTLSDTGAATGPGAARGGTVLDRDLQLVVNALWAGGAEAVAVGGVRLSPQASTRQAGGAVLVDDQPVFSPYEVVAIGDVGGLETAFLRSEAYVRTSALAQVYGIGFATERVDAATLPAAGLTGGGFR